MSAKGDLGEYECIICRIRDTAQLALLIDERDEILENLEVAEAKYVQSFRLSTPDPSIADFEPHLSTIAEEPGSSTRPVVSRPRPLAGQVCAES